MPNIITDAPNSIVSAPLEVTNDTSTNNQTNNDPDFDLPFCFMVLDTAKAMKTSCDPVSECVGCIMGVACCVGMIWAETKENSKPATRGDVIYAKQERRNQAAALGGAFAVGYCLSDVLIDSTATILGGGLGLFRATAATLTGGRKRKDDVLCFTREEIDEVNLFSSCQCSS